MGGDKCIKKLVRGGCSSQIALNAEVHKRTHSSNRSSAFLQHNLLQHAVSHTRKPKRLVDAALSSESAGLFLMPSFG